VIPAGGSGQLTAKVTTKSGTSGRLAKNISVQTDAPGAENLRLVVNFNVVTPIVATPAHRVYINTLEGNPKTHRVLLHRADGESLELALEKPVGRDGVQVELVAAEPGVADAGMPPAQSGDQWLVVTADGISGGSDYNDVIVLTTNDPKAPRLELPLVVRVRPLIDVRPNPVRLWPPDGGPDGSSALVRLGHGGRLKFEIRGVEVADPSLISAEVVSQGAQQIHSLRVALKDGVAVDGKKLQTSVRISTSDRAKPVVELPVDIFPRNQVVRRQPATVREPVPAAAGSPAGGH
jgi:hypothetical protein